MEFSLVPSFEFTDLHQVHPYILYLEVKGDRPNLWKYRSDLTNSAAWKVVLILLNDTIFAIDNETGAKIEVGNLENGDQISMGGRHLRFVVVKPYAHSEKEQTPHIETLIRNKVAANEKKQSNINAEDIIAQFSDSPEERSRCRIQVRMYQQNVVSSSWSFVDEAFTREIYNSNCRTFGYFKIAWMSAPHWSCNQRGWDVTLVSEYALDDDVVPVLVLDDPGEHQTNPKRVESVFPNFQPILIYKRISSTVFAFQIPAQTYEIVNCLREFHQPLFVTYYRGSDKTFAQNMMPFEYVTHKEAPSECCYCIISKMVCRNDMKTPKPISNVKRKNSKGKDTDCTTKRRNHSFDGSFDQNVVAITNTTVAEPAVAPDQNGNTERELTVNDILFNDLFDVILPPSNDENNFARLEKDCISESSDISTDSEDRYEMETLLNSLNLTRL